MPYTSLNFLMMAPMDYYVATHWVKADQASFIKQKLLPRAARATFVPISLMASLLDTILGVGLGMMTIATAGQHQQIFTTAVIYLTSTAKSISHVYSCLLRILHPTAPFPRQPATHQREAKPFSDPQTFEIFLEGNGLVAGAVLDYLEENAAKKALYSKSFFKRHGVSRLSYALMPLAALVTRSIDGIIGVLAAALSFAALGKFGSLNNLAFRGLQVPGIVFDLFYCTIKCINPWTKICASSSNLAFYRGQGLDCLHVHF